MNKLRRFLVLFVSLSASTSTLVAQCLEGDCQNGFGTKKYENDFYVGSFYNGKRNGAGSYYHGRSGNITIEIENEAGSGLSIVEFADGTMEFGYRRSRNDSRYLYNGFIFSEEGLFKYIEGKRYPLNFAFEDSKCLIGNCENGFGAEYLEFVTEKKDSISYLYVGNYKNGAWDGEGGYYDFSSGDFFVGVFLDNKEWNGGFFNEDDGDADFYADGDLVATLKYVIPDEPVAASPASTPASSTSSSGTTAAAPPTKRRGSFWKDLGEFVGGVGVAMLEMQNDYSQNKTVRVKNTAYADVEYLYISKPSEDSWGDDILNSNQVLGRNETMDIVVPCGKWDIRIEMANGKSCVRKDVTLCAFSTSSPYSIGCY